MSNFVVSARKYRPIRFDSVVGQQHVSNTLKNAIRSEHLAQAFLFCGPRGVGKTTCARILAKLLNCENPTSDTEPCDKCPSCTAFRENASLNIHELDAASNNSVEHIRSLIEQVRFAPQKGRYKIYIIDEVHMLSQAAFNAFLKTLEEPPSYAIFILATTEKHKIIPTILSRCQIFDFNRIQVADMRAHLAKICQEEGIEAEEEALNMIAQKADGALRDALSIFDRMVSFSGSNIRYEDVIENLNILDYDYYFQIIDAILAEDMQQLLLIFDQIQRKGFDGDIFLDGLSLHLRNLLMAQDASTLGLLDLSEKLRQRYQQQAQLAPKDILVSALSLSAACDVNYKMARNKRLHVEMALIKMAHIRRAIQPQTLAPQQVVQYVQTVESSPKEVVQEGAAPSKKQEEPKETTSPKVVAAKEEPKEAAPKLEKKPKKSLKERLKKKKETAIDALKAEIQAEEERKKQIVHKSWEEKAVLALWEAYAQKMESPSMQALLRSAKLTVLPKEEQALGLVVSSQRVKDAIGDEQALLNQLREEFGLPKLQYKFTIEEPKEEDIPKPKHRPTTDREKYVHFLKQNGLLKDFQKRFELFPPKKR
ncbi:DNA polymerase III subunit gamma/tau [Saprospira grandis]|uniref:DNA polymerase III subunit gamma/tau n=1 Tax=Saprospira grandis (strain Lewin) TaxID=984262 RepID=H6L586_SAPGL|nr:DNA polymerase III subunit gamma/tau [Saprospira grandis]AFC24000.1 DNA polymerase III, subunits gamma and tau [Saprospira grandis str. Lewin]